MQAAKLSLLALVLSVLCVPSLRARETESAESESAESEFVWMDSLDTAQKLAAKSNRLLLIHFSAPWCGPCQRLEKNVFSKPGFGAELTDRFVAVKLNYDHYPSTARQYGVQYIPADVIATSKGEMIQKIQSPRTAKEYSAALIAIADQSGQSAARQIAENSPKARPRYQPKKTERYSGYQKNSPAPRTEAVSKADPGRGSPGSQDADYTSDLDDEVASGRMPDDSNAAPRRDGHDRVFAGKSPSEPGAYTAPSKGVMPEHSDVAAGKRRLSSARDRQLSQQVNQMLDSAGQQDLPRGHALDQPPSDEQPSDQQPSDQTVAENADNVDESSTADRESAGPNSERHKPKSSKIARTPQIPPGNPPLALEGFSPVSLCETKKWRIGDVRYGAIHRGRTYLFLSEDEQQKFLDHPDRYSPALSGFDPVLAMDEHRNVEGTRRHGVTFEGRIYLFSSDASLSKFRDDPDRYSAEVVQAMK